MNKKWFQQHLASVHEEVVYSCDQCDKKTMHRDNLQQHIASVHDGVHYSCDHCD